MSAALDQNPSTRSLRCATPNASLRKLTKKVIQQRAIQEREDFPILLFASFCLCFNAAIVNAVTLSSYFKLPTAHVTGLISKESFALADEQWKTAYLPITTWCCFLVGATLSGYTISYETFYLGRTYGRSLLLIATFQALALAFDKSTVSNKFSSHHYLYVCAMACGLQNGLTTKYSGSTIRTTHLTGATTDLGIAIGHIMKGRYEEFWKVKLHSIAVIGFLLGGVFGRLGYLRFKEMTLLVNVTILTVLGISHMLYIAHTERLPLVAVARSRVDVKIHHRLQTVKLGPEAREREQQFRAASSLRNLERIRGTPHVPQYSFSSLRSESLPGPSAIKEGQLSERSGSPLPPFLRNMSGTSVASGAFAGLHPREDAYSYSLRSPTRFETLEEHDGRATPAWSALNDDSDDDKSAYGQARSSADVDQFDVRDVAAEDSDVEEKEDVAFHQHPVCTPDGEAQVRPTHVEEGGSTEHGAAPSDGA